MSGRHHLSFADELRALPREMRKNLAETRSILVPVLACIALTQVAWVNVYDCVVTKNIFPFGEEGSMSLFDGIANAASAMAVIALVSGVMITLAIYHFKKTVEAWLALSCIVASLLITGTLFHDGVARLALDKNTQLAIVSALTTAYGGGAVLAFFTKHMPDWFHQLYVVTNCASIAVFYLTCMPGHTAWFLLAAVVGWDIFAVLSPMGPLKLALERAQDYSADTLRFMMFTAATDEKEQQKAEKEEEPTAPVAATEVAAADKRDQVEEVEEEEDEEDEDDEELEDALEDDADSDLIDEMIEAWRDELGEHDQDEEEEDAMMDDQEVVMYEMDEAWQDELGEDEEDEDEENVDMDQSFIHRPERRLGAGADAPAHEDDGPTAADPFAGIDTSNIDPAFLQFFQSMIARAAEGPMGGGLPHFEDSGTDGDSSDTSGFSEEEEEDVVAAPAASNNNNNNNNNISNNKGEARSAKDALDSGAHLGFGDFIFYSILVGKSMAVGFLPAIVTTIGVITGLACTLTLGQETLPALPISIVLGMIGHFATVAYIATLEYLYNAYAV